MSKWIEADAFLKEYCEPYPHIYKAMSRAMAEAPSIDIVRCGECEYWRAYETWSECGLWAGDPYETAKTNPYDFCSYGERKESE